MTHAGSVAPEARKPVRIDDEAFEDFFFVESSSSSETRRLLDGNVRARLIELYDSAQRIEVTHELLTADLGDSVVCNPARSLAAMRSLLAAADVLDAAGGAARGTYR